MSIFEIEDLHVFIEDKETLKGVNLTLKAGEITAITGPNGTGKPTSSAAIVGDPNYEVIQEETLLDGENILELEVGKRVRLGFLFTIQYLSEIPRIINAEFIRVTMNTGKEDDDKISIMDFITKLDEEMEFFGMKEEMAERYLNEGFPGGGKKRSEILRLLMFEPRFILLDGIGSGLGIGALKIVSKGINVMRDDNFGAMIITYYQRLLNYITLDVVHIMMGERVVPSDDVELTACSEKGGYAKIAEELGLKYEEEV